MKFVENIKNTIRAMEADTISKHGRNPKSQTSRSNLLCPKRSGQNKIETAKTIK
ncbi:MAG: hypothetical protein FWH18_08080 [Marinilabiliaceae bacterium]|nr:hypothetical protein [Marinilabiliaceae bacterium]